MNLHNFKEDFTDLCVLAAKWRGIPESAVKRDYYIVYMLRNLAKSEFADQCVFKGGTSLSKCYPGSIERFSEDIDLTFIPQGDLSNKQYDRILKRIESTMSEGGSLEKIPRERNDRNKSSFVWYSDERDPDYRIKLEIGSSVRPDPYSKRSLKTYIQEYLEDSGKSDAAREYDLEEIHVNVLGIERTFLDKVMSVKRHACCGTLNGKVRHIYDVVRLMNMPEIQTFISDRDELKRLIKLTKDTDSFYLEKRGISECYDPSGAYDFERWKGYFTKEIKDRYESLHNDLLYTDEKQDFGKAMETFEKIDKLFKEIEE